MAQKKTQGEPFTALQDFRGARDFPHPADRLAEVRKRARKFRERMQNGPSVLYYKTVDLVRVPYPTRYGLLNAFSLPTPLMHILNRLYVVQFKLRGQVKTLLFSPSDLEANGETPFFKRLSGRFGPFESIGKKFLAPILSTVEDALKRLGIAPEQIDYISYDHLHTQDLRKWLGTKNRPAYFPKAKLLVMEQEWRSTERLIGPQLDWYCPYGIDGIDPRKIVFLKGDTLLGEGLALISTPGHTEGNHSLVAKTDEGVFVSSENGVSADNYAPLSSRIPGVRKYAKASGMEVILNGNTLEGGLDQYISMVQEKEMAGPSGKNPEFYNFVPSSELTHYWGFPGIRPTFSFGPLEYGTVQRKL